MTREIGRAWEARSSPDGKSVDFSFLDDWREVSHRPHPRRGSRRLDFGFLLTPTDLCWYLVRPRIRSATTRSFTVNSRQATCSSRYDGFRMDVILA
jgi:hypothetical protein